MPHLRNPNPRPDSDYVPGAARFLVPGNRGRLLDPRRTPVSVVSLDPSTGHVALRIEDFEDRGAIWHVPFERVTDYQFELGSAELPDGEAAEIEEVGRRFDQPLSIAADRAALTGTERTIERLSERARGWIASESRFFGRAGGDLAAATRAECGPPELARDLDAFLEREGVRDLEAAFARTYVSNPHSGELVKGHRIVIAELGLAPFEGTIVRDPALFDGARSRERRAAHVLARLAFVRAMFAHAGIDAVALYRGMCSPTPLEPTRRGTFVSASFRFAVAESCWAPDRTELHGVLWRQIVPVSRVFVTFLETAAMNHPFREQEAVLFWEESAAGF